ncbi:SDR family oxidoreductase [Micromonospora sp. DT48]|uniref:SDR family oxidoreductase n=1 Tax=unclassified Micromonospora TaxID=2617518 RepID=UPI0012BC282D|nr:SDR family oxidoreductase [Micromonospora sp. CP22]MTK03717.1 sugar nucleotide-binding protein [Micromonospora sp. CP22]
MTAVRTVLLTGASGVVGTALIPELAPAHVVALVHRTPCADATESVVGDVTAPRLGLAPADYASLAARVDAVVHCAAHTGFSGGRQVTEDVNIAGTEAVVAFAADAGAPLYYVSTAFVARTELTRRSLGRGTGDASARPEDYLDSKRMAEQVVRDSGVPAVLIRPSVVIGDSQTGAISRFQGLHGISTVLLRNLLPLMPMPATSRLDFVPCDVVARAIASLVFDRQSEGEVWITAGRAAPTIEVTIDTAVSVGAELGIKVNRPRMVEPEMVDRLIRPVFIDPLPPPARRRFDDLLAMTALFVNAPVFPSTLGQLPRQPTALTAEQVTDAYRASLIYLAHAKKLVAPVAARVGAPA